MKATKGNKVYTISEAEKASFLKSGYDIYDDEGELVEYGKGKSVSYEKYVELENKYKALEKENAELKKAQEKQTAKK